VGHDIDRIGDNQQQRLRQRPNDRRHDLTKDIRTLRRSHCRRVSPGFCATPPAMTTTSGTHRSRLPP
jgi:hypothetical protein